MNCSVTMQEKVGFSGDWVWTTLQGPDLGQFVKEVEPQLEDRKNHIQRDPPLNCNCTSRTQQPLSFWSTIWLGQPGTGPQAAASWGGGNTSTTARSWPQPSLPLQAYKPAAGLNWVNEFEIIGVYFLFLYNNQLDGNYVIIRPSWAFSAKIRRLLTYLKTVKPA